MPDQPALADEDRHPPGPEPLWNESWYFDFHAADGRFGGYVRLGLYPNLGVSWFWACVVGEDRQLVTVVDHELALPRGDQLEVRGSGLWTDITSLVPLDHFSVQLESFGVGLDDPAEMYRTMRGDRVPLGLDLEWETEGTVFGYPFGVTRYEIPCRVSGEVLVGNERVEFDGFGQRDHSWGVRDWWSSSWCWFSARLDGGERVHAVDAGNGIGIGYRQRAGDLTPFFDCRANVDMSTGPLPVRGAMQIGDLECQLTPVAWAPVPLVAPDGRVSRFPRGLVRVHTAEAGDGAGWVEWNQPQVG
jgi:hypothetical protein